MLVILHLKRDLDHELALTVTNPLVPDFKKAFEDGTYNEKKTALRVEAARAILAAGGYTKVAEVDGTDLGRAYTVTNNVETSWSREPVAGVRVEGPGYIVGLDGNHRGYKSSDLGDIFEDTITGTKYVVDSIGFAAL